MYTSISCKVSISILSKTPSGFQSKPLIHDKNAARNKNDTEKTLELG